MLNIVSLMEVTITALFKTPVRFFEQEHTIAVMVVIPAMGHQYLVNPYRSSIVEIFGEMKELKESIELFEKGGVVFA